MKKITADKIALVIARDILKTNSQYQRDINSMVAREIANFVNTLSEEFQKNLDDGIQSSDIIKTYKNQSGG
ncbi:TPA: hypothetical protein QB621_001583 [Pasteurella multocida]|uniref:Uncharacterized protein n=1 Tax=Pasteurella multocida TaxID=747 RepID=A0AAW8VAJ7_PASMD|nr:hypothetical protein [Pasteurella multocida]QDA13611.1 hypothetical protein E0Z11_00740 [Pasteurella multocida subsp. multocida]MDH7436168.1 hypothetical protein [Pasteurella multocida]MDH7440032.1 hypothetical protein [Pasteurella multocida]MDT3453501.1 hypothetical protein [Pasteurella multocida]MDY0434133.1 hypothetical protein [Pasteurella multocida]